MANLHGDTTEPITHFKVQSRTTKTRGNALTVHAVNFVILISDLKKYKLFLLYQNQVLIMPIFAFHNF